MFALKRAWFAIFNPVIYLYIKTRGDGFVVTQFVLRMASVVQLLDIEFYALDGLFVDWPQYPVTKARFPIFFTAK